MILSNVMDPGDYGRCPSFQDDATKRKWNLWSYIDARDAAQAFRLALESKLKGAEIFVIANADSVMNRPNEELLNELYPNVPHKRALGPNKTLLSIEKARRVLGYKPRYTGRASSK
jgi:nucleoside-diphosphate-sugar epimerase